MEVKAYVVTHDEKSEVFFGVSRDEVAAEWIEGWGPCKGCPFKVVGDGAQCDCISIEIVEAPHFDQYARDGKVPLEAFHAAGWHWICESCDGASHWGAEPTGDWRVVGGHALCTECADYQEEAMREAGTKVVTEIAG